MFKKYWIIKIIELFMGSLWSSCLRVNCHAIALLIFLAWCNHFHLKHEMLQTDGASTVHSALTSLHSHHFCSHRCPSARRGCINVDSTSCDFMRISHQLSNTVSPCFPADWRRFQKNQCISCGMIVEFLPSKLDRGTGAVKCRPSTEFPFLTSFLRFARPHLGICCLILKLCCSSSRPTYYMQTILNMCYECKIM